MAAAPFHTAAEEAVAESLVGTALEGYRGVLPASLVEELREFLVGELLCTSYGRRAVRRASDDPVVARSEEVARLTVEIERRRGGGDAG
jgi:hypothetical protein